MFLRHATIEKNAILLLVLTLITVSIGGMVQIIPGGGRFGFTPTGDVVLTQDSPGVREVAETGEERGRADSGADRAPHAGAQPDHACPVRAHRDAAAGARGVRPATRGVRPPARRRAPGAPGACRAARPPLARPSAMLR